MAGLCPLNARQAVRHWLSPSSACRGPAARPPEDAERTVSTARLKSVSQVDTVSLDQFIADHELGPVDFIQIDIQGAALDVFEGGPYTLRGVLARQCRIK